MTEKVNILDVEVSDVLDKMDSEVTYETIGEQYIALGMLVRDTWKDVLEFDGYVDNINYSYVNTQQYKAFLGACCDRVGLGIVYDCGFHNTEVKANDKGQLTMISNVWVAITFTGNDLNGITVRGLGTGVSKGSGHASSIAETNALRNLITNTFMLPTNESDDDVASNSKERINKWHTEQEKADIKDDIVSKKNNDYALVHFAKAVHQRIERALESDNIKGAFRAKLEKFMVDKFNEDGSPITREENPDEWIVKMDAARKVMEEIDAEL